VDDGKCEAVAALLAVDLGRVAAELPERGARRRELRAAEDLLFRDVERGASSLRCGSHHDQQEQAREGHRHLVGRSADWKEVGFDRCWTTPNQIAESQAIEDLKTKASVEAF